MPASPSRSFVRRPAGPAAWLRAAGVVAAATAASEVAFRAGLDLAEIIMIYLAGVVWVAMHERRAVSLAAVCASVFLFDLMYVPPRWGLNPVNKAHFVTFAVMLAVGLLISRLAEQAREQRELAERRARRAQALAALSAGLSAAPDRAAVSRCLVEAVQGSLALPARLLEAPAASQGSWQWAVQGSGPVLGTLAVDGGTEPPGEEERDLLDGFARQAALALERCASEERSLAAQVEAEAERLRSTLLSGISHDFRTPLTTIVGAATSLLQQDARLDDGRRAMLVRSVRDEAERLHRVVSDLLDLTRLEEGAVALQPEWCPADDLVQEALAALGERIAGHPVALDVPRDAIVWCDPRLVEQALVNLLDNAARHTPAGTPVRISVIVDGGHWALRVADAGPGLSPGSERAVFRKFHRGPHPVASAGTGLGLAICAAVARVHQGRIEARNDGGACFILTLPQPVRPAALELE